MQNSKNIYASNQHTSNKSGSLKMIMSLKSEMLRIELYEYIKLVSSTRKLQKEYYREKEPRRRESLLYFIKKNEASIERNGNRIWKEYKLGDLKPKL